MKRLLVLIAGVFILAGCQNDTNSFKAVNGSKPPAAHTAESSTAATKGATQRDTQVESKALVEDIPIQTFDVELESWGKVRFVSTKRVNPDGGSELLLTLQDANKRTLFTFPQPELAAARNFESLAAVSFKDVDKDGKKDVIVLAE
ncbi:hypothetical protein [Paenibacillus sp. R14(2021)]|uniref:hypothetical protein n=1 Tax=Paenibacillus sp. R14(2021) TaxID=2859228 RepID=UPI001C6139FA|nr:hypothetical protein [Paenibacillus sp. R14(2021)]